MVNEPNVDGENESNVDGEDEPVIVSGTEGCEDNLYGKTVVDEEAAYDLYNHHAFRKDFSIWTLQKRKNMKGVMTALIFVVRGKDLRWIGT